MCAAIGNFFESVIPDIAPLYIEKIMPDLLACMQEEKNIMKECAITAISALAEGCGEDFGEYYDESFKLLIEYLGQEVPSELKQYKGQLIETITIMSVSVGQATFMPYA